MWRNLALLSFALWIAALAAAGWFFVKGSTHAADDGRTSVLLAAADRDFVLGEMRMLLQAVRGTAAGLAAGDRTQAAAAARSGGTAVSHTVPPALMTALPIDFKQMGIEVHESLDLVALAAEQGEPTDWVLEKLADTLDRCVACHEVYRLDAKP